MQKPDADGFITINWPSKNIPHGGIFHNRTVNPTQNQQEFLKVLLEESKLTITQRQNKALALRLEKEKRQKQKKSGPGHPQLLRPRTSRRRSLSEIRCSGAFDLEDYLPPKRGEDRELMKERLANKMTYGDEDPEPIKVSPPPNRREIKLPSNKEKWNDLVTQIRERTEWLAEMEYLGQAGPHRDIIKDQIAERMRALDQLGIDSECSTTRSTKSGFSTVRSTQSSEKLRSAAPSVASSKRSDKSVKKQVTRPTARSRNKEENVEAYSQMTPLQYSPRRRQ